MATKGESVQTEVKREVKVVKKQVKKESKPDVQNGDQNGDTEAQMTIKLPSKKSAAKTETKVEVVKKQLPDGSIEEVKTTITKTIVDGKTTIATKTETTIIPKEEEEEEEEYEEEEEEEEEENDEVVVQKVQENGNDEVTKEVIVKKSPAVVQNEDKTKIVTEEERSETTITKKVSVVQKQEPEEEEEEEIEEEVQQEESKTVDEPKHEPKVEVEKENIEKDEEVEEEVVEKLEVEKDEEEVEEEQEEEEEAVQPGAEKQPEEPEAVEKEVAKAENEETEEKVEEKVEKPQESKDEESEYTEEEYESEKEEVAKSEPTKEDAEQKEPEQEIKVEQQIEPKEDIKDKPEPQSAPKVEPIVPLREPSIPLEKVEDVEIKPIGLASETVTKSHTQNTEILTNNERPLGPTSTQTEYNRIENIVTVNRTTKTLDSTYEQLTQQGIPTVKTYFAPGRDRISTSPQPAKPYQPIYAPIVDQPQERRHSLLLERLSMERQVPSSDLYQQNYQYNNQNYEQQRQWSQEPQAEVLTVSNVKPSMITNSQWYQQNQSKKENILYNNVTPASPAPPSQAWNQSYLSPQPPLPPQTPIQPQAQPQPQYQPSYTDNITQDKNTYQQNNYQTYAPKPTTWGSNSYSNTDTQLSSTYNPQQNQYSSLNQSTTESYQKSTQQYSSSYVPPPWEQDSNYVADTSNQNYYQPPPQTTAFSPSTNQGWTPAPPKSKFSKPPPTAYIPPAPNQSFVKSVSVELPRVPGKKTYYSEYERRYITVPESNYIPGESKFQPQPDPSPQYYYDNNEPVEASEPQWRKELREFTEKTSQTTEQTSVKPPWEEENKYSKPPPSSTYTPTPTWSQTLRPNSYRERSFESEYVGSQEFKTNTLGRGRPLSTYGKSNVETIPERVRGVSVDRYNPNSYQPPAVAEHPPVQTHTLVPPAKSYHNPNVPAYHAQSRASAEPREQPIYPQSRQYVEARASPLQSRSFKYLQWITGTED